MIALSRPCREESLKGRRVAPLPPPPFPLRPCSPPICIAPRLAKSGAHTRKGGAVGARRKKGGRRWRHVPSPPSLKTRGEGGGGGWGGSHTRTGPGRPPVVGSGRMVMQAAADILVGGSNPGEANTAADHKICGLVCYHSTGGGCVTTVSPIAWSLLSENFCPPPPHTPPTPPSKKCYPVLGDRGLRIKKSIAGWSYWAK